MSDLMRIRLLLPLVMTAGFVVVSWIYGRVIRGGPLSEPMKRMRYYGALFVLGMCYLILWGEPIGRFFHWSGAWILLVVLWSFFLGGLALWRARRANHGRETAVTGKEGGGLGTTPRRGVLPGLLALALLVCSVGSAAEWGLWTDGQGSIPFAIAWSLGAAGLLAVGLSRYGSSVVLALRAFVFFCILGAIARHDSPTILLAVGSLAALVVAWRLPKLRDSSAGGSR